MGYSRKQANVIYRAFKEGKIEVDKATMGKIYEYADRPIGCNRDGWGVKHAIDAAVHEIKMGCYRDAQRAIASFAYSMEGMERLEAFNARNHELLVRSLQATA